MWIAGGVLFRVLEEPVEPGEPEGGWQAISLLIPAYNEESVIAVAVTAALASDYPTLEVLVLDDGSTDGTGPRRPRPPPEIRAAACCATR